MAGDEHRGKRVGDGFEGLLDHNVLRRVAGGDLDIGKRIDGIALIHEFAQCRGGIGGLQQRPVGLAAHPPQQHLVVGVEPDRHAALGDAFPGARVHEGAAAGGQDQRPAVKQAHQHAAFAVAEIVARHGRRRFRGSTCRRRPR